MTIKQIVIAATATITLLAAWNEVYARTKTKRETYTYQYSEDLSKKDAKEAATLHMRDRVMSEVATYVVDSMHMQYDGGGELTAKQSVEAITAGVVQIDIVEGTEVFDRTNRTYTAEFEMRYDPDDIKEQLQAAVKDKQRREELANIYRSIKEQEASMAVLERQRDSLNALAQREQQRCQDEERDAQAKYDALKAKYLAQAELMDKAMREQTAIVGDLGCNAEQQRLATLNADIARARHTNDSLRNLYNYLKPHETAQAPPPPSEDNKPYDERFFEHYKRGWQARVGLYAADMYGTIPFTLSYCYNKYMQFGAGLGWMGGGTDAVIDIGFNLYGELRVLYPDWVIQPYLALQAGMVYGEHRPEYDSRGIAITDATFGGDGWLGLAGGLEWSYKRFSIHAQLMVGYPFEVVIGGGIGWRFGWYK